MLALLLLGLVGAEPIEYEGRELRRDQFMKRCRSLSDRDWAAAREQWSDRAAKASGTLIESAEDGTLTLLIIRRRAEPLKIPVEFSVSKEGLDAGRFIHVFGVIKPNDAGYVLDVRAWEMEGPVVVAQGFRLVNPAPLVEREETLEVSGFVLNRGPQQVDTLTLLIELHRGLVTGKKKVVVENIKLGERRPVREFVDISNKRNVGSNTLPMVTVSIEEFEPVAINDQTFVKDLDDSESTAH